MNDKNVMDQFAEIFTITPVNACRFIEDNYNNMSKKDLANIIMTFLDVLPSLCIPEEEFDEEMKKYNNNLYNSEYVTDAIDCIVDLLYAEV